VLGGVFPGSFCLAGPSVRHLFSPEPEDAMGWYLHALQNYANFAGRARRKEYWLFTLLNALIAVVAQRRLLMVGHRPRFYA
jgi:hypothetical protein